MKFWTCRKFDKKIRNMVLDKPDKNLVMGVITGKVRKNTIVKLNSLHIHR